MPAASAVAVQSRPRSQTPLRAASWLPSSALPPDRTSGTVTQAETVHAANQVAHSIQKLYIDRSTQTTA